MDTIRKEVRELISVNERIQSALLQGDQLTDDEKDLVEMCASELIASMSAKENQESVSQRQHRYGAQFLRAVDGYINEKHDGSRDGVRLDDQ
jgi:hypothetical protein